jgi:hypothetical protein
MSNMMNPDGTHKVIAGYSHAAGLQERDQRIAELEAKLSSAKGAMQVQSDGYMRLQAENAKLVIESTDYRSSMEYWVEEYNKKNTENAKLREAVTHIDKLCTENAYHLDFILMCAIKNAADLLPTPEGSSDE